MGPNRNFNLAIGRAKLRGSAKVAFSVADSEIRWAELVPSRTVLTLSVQNGPACSKSALDKLGPIWPLGSIWLFSFYSVHVLGFFLGTLPEQKDFNFVDSSVKTLLGKI